MLLFGISLITLGSIASGMEAKFQLDKISAGALFSILPFGILAGSLLFGPFSDRYGYKIFFLLACFAMLIGFQGIAYANTLDSLRVYIFLFGLGGGVLNGATNAVVADISTENKGANLSLLGIFFALGALGMPSILGALEKNFSFESIVSFVGYLPLLAAVLFFITKFPEPKLKEAIPFRKGLQLLQEPALLLIGFFLFCQSSFEGLINNWTTTFLSHKLSESNDRALYALSSYVVGMAVMRLLMGGVFRKTSSQKLLAVSFAFLLAGCLLLHISTSYSIAVAGLVTIGAGLAAGYPVMLGAIGNQYAALSATAFSVVLTIALLGSMSINFVMGMVADAYGIQHLTVITFVLLSFMVILTFIINKRIKL
jgi:fucose permease